MKKLMILMMMTFSVIISLAEEFHGAALYDAEGSIKELKYKSQNPILRPNKIKFSRDGKINKSLFSYNEQGYPSQMGFNAGNMTLNLIVQYNENNDVKNLMYDNTIGKNSGHFNADFFYTDGVLTSMQVSTTSDKESRDYMFEYSDYVNDEHGNWISRNVKQTLSISGKEEVETVYTETRTIKYY